MNLVQKWGATLCALVLATPLAGCWHWAHPPLVPVSHTIETSVWHVQHSDTHETTWSVEGSSGTVRTYVKYLGPTRNTSTHEPMYKCVVTYSEAGTHYYYVQRIAENEARHVSFGITEGEEPDKGEGAKLADFRKVCGPLPDEAE